jgi:hypothetical protein
MMTKEDIEEWLATLPARTMVGIDDGGLALEALDEDNAPYGPYLEVGGIPLDDED